MGYLEEIFYSPKISNFLVVTRKYVILRFVLKQKYQ
jgi:hypothetical protein